MFSLLEESTISSHTDEMNSLNERKILHVDP